MLVQALGLLAFAIGIIGAILAGLLFSEEPSDKSDE
jgi:uncharacterized membrane protein YbaN (DUF454 family)